MIHLHDVKKPIRENVRTPIRSFINSCRTCYFFGAFQIAALVLLVPLGLAKQAIAGSESPSVSSVDALLTQATQRSRPRSVDIRALQAKHMLDAGVLAGLLHRIASRAQEVLPIEPVLRPDQLPQGIERVTQLRIIQKLVFEEEGKILPAALVWRATGNRQALDEAKRRALNLASWNTHGVTSFKAHDQAGLSITWTLALAYDWLYPELGEAERARLVVAIGARLSDILGKGSYGLDDGRRIDVFPYDSHGAVALARVSAICAVMSGVSPQFDACFRNTVPRYLKRPVPWGRDDGGYANGTAYGQWDTTYTHLVVWNLLRESIGVDLTKKPWAQGYGKFIAYFLPPGTPMGSFGDGAEKSERNIWATQARAYAALVPSPLADWYARQQFGEDVASLPLLLAPYRDWSKTPAHIPADTPNAILMPSIGWVAMHSNLADRGRNSVYFKSSPYGSFNHSHADQNSFVINAQGQPLAIDSGYYDYYNSPHWKGWYKQTRAHNAMTFDGGQGQLHDTMAAKGKITQFETTPAYDMVTGDATQAYGGALSHAVRSMVYVRPGVILVFDSLASDTPRTWEWNIHALKAVAATGKRSIEIEKDGERLCVEVLRGPDMDFSQTDQFGFEPSGDYPKQWHGVFKSAAKSKTFQMLTLLSVNCERPPVEVTDDSAGLGVALAGHRFVFSNSNVERVQ
ncbi:MAG: heparinase II/III domain-containing protein [Thiobacillus sp.]